MEKQFVTYEIALAVKELGFDEPCLAYYKPIYEKDKDGYDVITYSNLHSFAQSFDEELETWNYSELDADGWDGYLLAPLWQQAIDWLRKVHEIHINVDCFSEKGGTKWDYQIVKCDYDSVGLPGYILTEFADGRNYLAYENALESGLVEALKWVKFRKEQL